jgi:hypothetical protein
METFKFAADSAGDRGLRLHSKCRGSARELIDDRAQGRKSFSGEKIVEVFPSARLGVHATAQASHNVECATVRDFVLRQCPPIRQLQAFPKKTLLIQWDVLLFVNHLLDARNSVGGIEVKHDGPARQRLDK